MDPLLLNAPRYPTSDEGRAFHEVWYVALADPRGGTGLWLRYTVDRSPGGPPQPTLWASFFDRARADRTFALCRRFASTALAPAPGAAIAFGGAELSSAGCSGELNGGGHALRWRLAFESPPLSGEDQVPSFLSPLARLRGSGFVLAHPAMLVTGALELDGELFDLRDLPGGQAHLWGTSRWPRHAWARCSAFAEDPEASLDLLTVEGPAAVEFKLFTFRFRGETHRFGELPWSLLSTSVDAAPTWHFSAQDATCAIDGVVSAPTERMVQVPYEEPAGRRLHCVHTELASLELSVRTRAFPGTPWRQQGTLHAIDCAALEFCGRDPDPRVARWLDVAEV